MRPEVLDVRNEIDFLAPSYDAEIVDPSQGVWMRSCPHCNAVLRKDSPWETVRCPCGWEWQS